MTNLQAIHARWTGPDRPKLAKRELIDDEGCCCAQGDMLRQCGWTDQRLRDVEQDDADREIAKEYGISLFHSVLLRKINDSADGQPELCAIAEQDEAAGLATLGPQHRELFALGRAIDALTSEQWHELEAAREAAGYSARYAARYAAWYAARAAARAAAGDATWAAAEDAAGVAAGDAAWALFVRDLIGRHGFEQDHYDTLTRPWRTVVGRMHADDEDLMEGK